MDRLERFEKALTDILSEYDISVFYAAIYSYYNHIGSTDEKYQQY